MASRRILKDTVVLANFIGEVNDVATFQYTTLKNVYCYSGDGAAVDNVGKRGSDSVTLYIFDSVSTASDDQGNKRSYLDQDEWDELQGKSGYWTLHDGGRDTIRKAGETKEYRVMSSSRLVAGTRRMWHFEVSGR